MKRTWLTAFVFAAFAVLLLAGCGVKEPPATARNSLSWGAQDLITQAKDFAGKSLAETNRSQARELALHGVDAAERCLMVAPEEPGCYYWRAVNTGLYHRVHIIGYQRGVKRMIDDCMKVISIDPRYNHAGAYRILGELYTKLPQTGGTTESVTRDLALAEQYLREAVKLSPDYPENHILLAETLIAQENVPGSASALKNAKDLTPHWKRDASYDSWKSSMIALEKKVRRAGK